MTITRSIIVVKEAVTRVIPSFINNLIFLYLLTFLYFTHSG